MNNQIMSQDNITPIISIIPITQIIQINFEKTGLPIQESILNLPLEQQSEIYNYLIQINEPQKKAYIIAKDHLKTSFNIFKSNGYIEWKKSNKKI